MSLRRYPSRSSCCTLRCAALSALLALFAPAATAATDVWCPHVTAYGGWKTEVSLYASGGVLAPYRLEKFDVSGGALGALEGTASAKGWTAVPPASLGYEGSAKVTSERDLLVKVSYQLGDSPSVCEFYLAGASGVAWVLPNAARSWMSYSGLALVNSGGGTATVALEAWKNGLKAAPDAVVEVGGMGKYVKLSWEVWPGLGYDGFDTVVVRSSSALQAPLLITGNAAGDRNLFFLAQPEPPAGSPAGGDLVEVDPVVGNLRYVPAGAFAQGSPADEPCRGGDETQFAHTLTKSMAVMETEATRQMWADLKAAQPTLPADPTDHRYGFGMANPVQGVTWYEAVLFANLLSLQRGLQPCYYSDEGFTAPIDASNHTSGPFYCNWDANGYRLPSEGEWEYFSRAGTATPFWVIEPNYTSANCGSSSTAGLYPKIETAAWFWANNSPYGTKPVGGKSANPWNLMDVHGNVWEWCWDLYGAYPEGPATDYRGASADSYRVKRGGSWSYDAQRCRSAIRNGNDPGYRYSNLGLRLARSLP